MIALVWHKYKPIQAQDFYWSEDCKFSISTAQCDKHAPGIGSHGCSSLPLCPLFPMAVSTSETRSGLSAQCAGGVPSWTPHCLLTALPLLLLLWALQEVLSHLAMKSHLQRKVPATFKTWIITFWFHTDTTFLLWPFFLWFLLDYQISTGLSIFLSFVSIPQHSIMLLNILFLHLFSILKPALKNVYLLSKHFPFYYFFHCCAHFWVYSFSQILLQCWPKSTVFSKLYCWVITTFFWQAVHQVTQK